MWKGKRPIDDYNFYSLLGIVQSGMWLQHDIELYLKDFDISLGRFSILLSIFETKDRRISGRDLSRKVGVSKTTISKMLKKLLEHGLINSYSTIQDKRIIKYELTKSGITKLHEIIPGYLMRMRIIGSNISVEEKKQLINILNKINFIDDETILSKFSERPLSEKAKEIKQYCNNGTSEDIDKVMQFLDDASDIPLTRVVDFYLGTVKTIEGMKRIEYYLFNGTQIQRNYATLFFVRIDDWMLVKQAYNMGLIDYIQAYSK